MRQKYNNETNPTGQESSKQPTEQEEEPVSEDTESLEGGATVDEHDEPTVFAKTPFCLYKGHTSDLLDVSWSKVRRSFITYPKSLSDIRQPVFENCLG